MVARAERRRLADREDPEDPGTFSFVSQAVRRRRPVQRAMSVSSAHSACPRASLIAPPCRSSIRWKCGGGPWSGSQPIPSRPRAAAGRARPSPPTTRARQPGAIAGPRRNRPPARRQRATCRPAPPPRRRGPAIRISTMRLPAAHSRSHVPSGRSRAIDRTSSVRRAPPTRRLDLPAAPKGAART